MENCKQNMCTENVNIIYYWLGCDLEEGYGKTFLKNNRYSVTPTPPLDSSTELSFKRAIDIIIL